MHWRRGIIVSSAAALLLVMPGYAQMQPSRGSGKTVYNMESGSAPGSRSSWVEIGRSGAVGTPSGPEIRIAVTNKQDRPLRVKVLFEAEGKNGKCERTRELKPKEIVNFSCLQDSLESDRSYPVTIEVFKADRKRRVDVVRLRYAFGEREVAQIESQVARMKPGR